MISARDAAATADEAIDYSDVLNDIYTQIHSLAKEGKFESTVSGKIETIIKRELQVLGYHVYDRDGNTVISWDIEF